MGKLVKGLYLNKQTNKGDLLLLQDDAVIWDVEDHGAGIWSFRSQTKLIPEDGSNMASDGRLGRRHPNSGKTDNNKSERECEGNE